ncbi:MAG: hypothetical protein WCI74_08275, partial [Actinomycetes bacterium]
LAADFVGQGDSGTAMHAWQSAQRVAAEDDWRQQVRLAWVNAEISLMTDRPGDAFVVSMRAVETARSASAPRHAAKSLLFAGVSSLGIDQDRSVKLLTEAAAEADRLGLFPLVWPIRAALADSCADPVRAMGHRMVASEAIDEILRGLPPALAAAWRTRPEVVANSGSSNPNE